MQFCIVLNIKSQVSKVVLVCLKLDSNGDSLVVILLLVHTVQHEPGHISPGNPATRPRHMILPLPHHDLLVSDGVVGQASRPHHSPLQPAAEVYNIQYNQKEYKCKDDKMRGHLLPAPASPPPLSCCPGPGQSWG